jgi:aminotransferase in exopolysaccharide biosynthesis
VRIMSSENKNSSGHLVEFIRDIYQTKETIHLHEPTFSGNEKLYLAETIDSTFVSGIGRFVDLFESKVEALTKTAKAISTVNGTAALQSMLYLSGIRSGDMVITQALTFVATCNALHYVGARPIFIDIELTSFSLCPDAVTEWLSVNAELDDQRVCRHKQSGSPIKALMPMHTFGHPAKLEELLKICELWNLTLLEDAAESLGSYYKGQHTGTFGRFAAVSFNGNKIITTGGGGMILCQDKLDGAHAKHITTTAKVPHAYEFYHDEPGFNFRLPNVNAAIGCAQMEQLNNFLTMKRSLASKYEEYFFGSEYMFVKEPEYARSNYWLNAIVCVDLEHRTALLNDSHSRGVIMRPVWQLMHRLPMFKNDIRDELKNSIWAEQRLINLPSSPPSKLV